MTWLNFWQHVEVVTTRLVDLARRPCTPYGFLFIGFWKQWETTWIFMFYKIVLFFNLVSVALAIYILISYLKNRNRNKNMKNQDDAVWTLTMYYPFMPICTMVFFPCDHKLAIMKGCFGSLSFFVADFYENQKSHHTFAASQRGAFYQKAEIIPNEPGRVMLPRECANCASWNFYASIGSKKSISNKE